MIYYTESELVWRVIHENFSTNQHLNESIQHAAKIRGRKKPIVTKGTMMLSGVLFGSTVCYPFDTLNFHHVLFISVDMILVEWINTLLACWFQQKWKQLIQSWWNIWFYFFRFFLNRQLKSTWFFFVKILFRIWKNDIIKISTSQELSSSDCQTSNWTTLHDSDCITEWKTLTLL